MLIRVLDLPRFIEIDLKPDKKLRQGSTETHAVARGSKNKKQVVLKNMLEKVASSLATAAANKNPNQAQTLLVHI